MAKELKKHMERITEKNTFLFFMPTSFFFSFDYRFYFSLSNGMCLVFLMPPSRDYLLKKI